MDIKEIKQIIDLMKRSNLTEFEIEQEGLKLKICRASTDKKSNASAGMTPAPFMVDPSTYMAPVATPAPAPVAPSPTAASPAQDEVGIEVIKSPMVGTFYAASSPETPPFAVKGASVNDNTVVCIIEAMKVMNEIHAEMSGSIVEVLAENGQAVEFGQPLFKVKKA